jgi:hypothetical protein
MFSSRALYYPTIDIRDEEWLKTAFLFWDEISTFSLGDYEYSGVGKNTLF